MTYIKKPAKSKLSGCFNYYIIYYIVKRKRQKMKPKDEVTRSLVIDRQVWDESMKYARVRYKMSLSKVIDKLLEEWVSKEKRRPLENENQGSFF